MGSSSGGFFDRLGKSSSPRRRVTKAEHITNKVNSIRAQLALILNARKGSSPCAPDFGLDDFNDAAVGTMDMISTITNDIKVTINRYEPRITVTDVIHTPHPYRQNPLELTVVINGYINVDNRDEKIDFEMILDCLSHQWKNRRMSRKVIS